MQDHAICPRCDIEIESEEHRFYVCQGTAEGDTELVDIVANTDWILPEAREGLTKPDLLSFFLRGGPDCRKLCRDIKELSRFLGAKPTSLQVISTSLV